MGFATDVVPNLYIMEYRKPVTNIDIVSFIKTATGDIKPESANAP
jgi:hypothetical protein